MKDILYGLGAMLLLALMVIWGLALALAGPALLNSVFCICSGKGGGGNEAIEICKLGQERRPVRRTPCGGQRDLAIYRHGNLPGDGAAGHGGQRAGAHGVGHDGGRMEKVYLTEDWPESVSNVLGLNLAPYAQGEQDTEKLKVAAAPNGLWCSACRCKVDGELIFYNEAYLAPLAEEIKKSEYIYYTARQTEAGQRYLVVHDGMDVLAAIMPMNILKEEYINDLAEFQALCMEQFYKDKERREAVIEEAEDDEEDAGQIGMEGVEDGE